MSYHSIRLLQPEQDIRPQYKWIARRVVLCPALHRYQSQLWCYACRLHSQCPQARVTLQIPLKEVLVDPTVLKKSATVQTVIQHIRRFQTPRRKKK